MSGLRTLWSGYTQYTACTECGRRLASADEWRECRRRHAIEYWQRTDPKLLELARDCHPKGGVR